jgi:hypothetical protein
MTQTAEFEEKTFEKYFSQELTQWGTTSYSPGQFAESFLGFDDAFDVPWPILHWRFRHLMPRLWSRLPGISTEEINRLAKQLSSELPYFRLNLFVQYKRPQFVSGNRGKERTDWQCDYYRYLISTDQQKTLEKLHSLSKGRAAVVYASPAFWKSSELFNAHRKRNVISLSNIVSVDKLVGHGRFTYAHAGGVGKAYSKPVEIESTKFENLINEGLKSDGLLFHQHVKNIAKLIKDTLKDDERGKDLLSLARAALGISPEIEPIADTADSFVDALMTIEAFCDVFGVSFYAMG